MRKIVTGRHALLGLAFLAVTGWLALRGLPDGRLHVWFLDVGQGDAILIQTPEGRQILIDGGPSPSALASELGEVMPFWDRSLDLVIMTHPDSDHSAGLIPLYDRFAVGAALDALAPGDTAGATWLDATAEARRQSVVRGTQIKSGRAVLTVLNPSTGLASETDNNHSLALRLDYGATSLLLMGDAEEEAELEMLASGQPLKADVLKAGHHGSKASTTPAFLAAVKPGLVVISAGADNRFGHPSSELLARLAGIEVMRTDQQGRIELVSDGERWTATSER